jgi:hypothetical protein
MHHEHHREHRGTHDDSGERLAQGLAWFSIALGTIELLAARSVTRSLGMQGQETLVRAYGLREITKGVGILTAKDPTPWVWARVAGDALDLGTLASAYGDENPQREKVGMALLNVAGVAALDVYCAQLLSGRRSQGRAARRNRRPMRDYSNRSGFPRPAEEMRGVARDATIPADMRTPEALRPFTTR